jgi:hypothetical protein
MEVSAICVDAIYHISGYVIHVERRWVWWTIIGGAKTFREDILDNFRFVV